MKEPSKFADVFAGMLRRQKATVKPMKPPVKTVKSQKPVKVLSVAEQERKRVKQIAGLPEAKSNPEMADFLIYETDCDPENARIILGWGRSGAAQ
jgi:hypothetical protein